MPEQQRTGIDTTTPNVARIYDYLLNGKDNFEVDREAAQQLLAAIPDVAITARANRKFLGRVVRYLAGVGIRQFLDLGSGLPTQENVHQVAHAVAPQARVVYVDSDPVVWSHGQALLACGHTVAAVRADLRDPGTVLGDVTVRRLLDFTQPLALICTSTLHFISDQEGVHQIIAEYRDRLAPGSYLAVSHGTLEEDPRHDAEKAASIYRTATSHLHLRSLPDVVRFFDGFELIEPGVVWLYEWRPDADVSTTTPGRSMRGGVGRKP